MICTLAPRSYWYTQGGTDINRSSITKIRFMDSYDPDSYDDTWDASEDMDGSVTAYIEGSVLTIAGNGSGKIYANENSGNMFGDVSFNGENLETMFSNVSEIYGIDILDVSNVKNFSSMFAYCFSLNELDLTSWDVSKAETMRFMFGASESVGEMGLVTLNLKGWKMPNCQTFAYMFANCTNLISIGDVSDWNIGGSVDSEIGVDASNMFLNCESLSYLSVKSWNVSKVRSFKSAFKRCTYLSNLDVSKWDVSNVKDMNSMFSECSSLTSIDVSGWDVSFVTNMNFMFHKCYALRYLDVSKWDTSNVVDMGAMFQGDTHATGRLVVRLKGIENWNTSSVENMGWMFYSIRLLPKKGNDTAAEYAGEYDIYAIYELDLSGWDVSKVKNFHHMFAHSANIYLKGIENWKIGAKIEPVEGDDKSYISMNCFLHRTVNDYYDLSNWDVSKVRDFRGMFRQCKNLVKVDGLDKWNTSSGKSFSVMFSHCVSMIELDVSGFDTRNASESYKDPYRGDDYTSYTGVAMQGFFGVDSSEGGTNMQRVVKIKVGKNFSFNGDGSATVPAILPTIDTAIFTDSDGKWYDAAGVGYEPNAVPNLFAAIYYASPSDAAKAGEERVSVKNGTMLKTANAIRENGEYVNIIPSEFSEKIRSQKKVLNDSIEYYRRKAEGSGEIMSDFIKKHPNYFDSPTTGTYNLGNAIGALFEDAFQINIISICTNSKTFNYGAMNDYGIVVFRDENGIYNDSVPTVEEILGNEKSVVYTKESTQAGTTSGYKSYDCILRPVWANEANIIHYCVPYMIDSEGVLHVRKNVYSQVQGSSGELYDINLKNVYEDFMVRSSDESRRNVYAAAVSFFEAYDSAQSQ